MFGCMCVVVFSLMALLVNAQNSTEADMQPVDCNNCTGVAAGTTGLVVGVAIGSFFFGVLVGGVAVSLCLCIVCICKGLREGKVKITSSNMSNQAGTLHYKKGATSSSVGNSGRTTNATMTSSTSQNIALINSRTTSPTNPGRTTENSSASGMPSVTVKPKPLVPPVKPPKRQVDEYEDEYDIPVAKPSTSSLMNTSCTRTMSVDEIKKFNLEPALDPEEEYDIFTPSVSSPSDHYYIGEYQPYYGALPPRHKAAAAELHRNVEEHISNVSSTASHLSKLKTNTNPNRKESTLPKLSSLPMAELHRNFEEHAPNIPSVSHLSKVKTNKNQESTRPKLSSPPVAELHHNFEEHASNVSSAASNFSKLKTNTNPNRKESTLPKLSSPPVAELHRNFEEHASNVSSAASNFSKLKTNTNPNRKESTLPKLSSLPMAELHRNFEEHAPNIPSVSHLSKVKTNKNQESTRPKLSSPPVAELHHNFEEHASNVSSAASNFSKLKTNTNPNRKESTLPKLPSPPAAAASHLSKMTNTRTTDSSQPGPEYVNIGPNSGLVKKNRRN